MLFRSIFRDDLESFFFGKYKDDKYLLDEKAVVLGILKETYIFVIEEPIECACELGYDGFYGNGKYIPFSWGPEIAKNLYIGKVINDIDEMPECLTNTLNTISPLLERMEYNGPLSTEERVISKTKSYFIDFCARVPAPLGQLYPVAINNWRELCVNIGNKKNVEIDCDFEYVGAFALSAEHALDHNVKIMVDQEHRKDIRFQMIAENKDGYFSIKGNTAVCVLVAGGKNPKEVINKLKEAKDFVNGYSLEKDTVDGIEQEFEEALDGMKSIGIKF